MAPDEAREGGRGIRDQIERYRTAFIAVVTMIVIAAGSAGYILAHERLSVPAWVPILGHESFVLKGEFSTAQAVTPGQGQSVTIAGAKIGEISNVELRDGRALVSMNLTPKYAQYIYRDATALLRPKTGLKDETVEISPGNPSSGRVSGGYTIPVTQTSPDGNLDEFLASFDTETRALLQALLAGVGEGLNGNSANLSATFKRFAPLAHEFTEIGREVAKRQYYVEHGIHNFRLLMEALGSKDTKLAQSVEYGNAVFATFSQEDRQVQETLHELPGVLKQANHGFGKLATATRVTGKHAARARALRHRARAGAEGGASLLQDDHADPQERSQAALPPDPAGARTAGALAEGLHAVLPAADDRVHRDQRILQRARLQPGAQSGQLPVLPRLGQPRPQQRRRAGRCAWGGGPGAAVLQLRAGACTPARRGGSRPDGESDPRPAQPADHGTVQVGAAPSSAAAKAASLSTGVSPDALMADRVFGQGPDATAVAPSAALGGDH